MSLCFKYSMYRFVLALVFIIKAFKSSFMLCSKFIFKSHKNDASREINLLDCFDFVLVSLLICYNEKQEF